MKQPLLLILLSSILFVLPHSTHAFQIKDNILLLELKQHFAFVKQLKKLSVIYSGERQTTYQSDDYQQPFTIKSHYEYQYDIDTQQFYFHDRHVYPGNFIFDKKIVHQQGKTILYDVNGFDMGKQLEFLEYGLSDFRQDLTNEVDFLAADQFLSNTTDTLIDTHKDQNWVELTQSEKEAGKVTYRFTLKPIQLTSITYHDSDKKTEFSQPTKGMEINYASTVKHYKEGKLRQNITISKVQEIPFIERTILEVPQGYGPFVDTQEKPLQWVNIAKGLYLINYVSGDRHVMVKTDNQGLTIFGAPRSSKVSEQVMALINKHLPDKSIHSVYITHAHSDHIGGLSHYGNLGVKIVASAYTIEAIMAYPRFEEDAKKWQFNTIRHEQKLNDATYYVPNNSHSKGQSLVYFADAQIIYQGDFLELPFDNSIPTHMSNVEKEFIEFLHQEKLQYKRIVGHHRNNNITPEVVDKFYNTYHPL